VVKHCFPKIVYRQLETSNINGVYYRDTNKIVVNISPSSFKAEYEFYGFRGLVRSLSAILIHELTHWATRSFKGHEDRRTVSNSWRTRNVLNCDLWTLRIHSILYDLQRKNPCYTYLGGKIEG